MWLASLFVSGFFAAPPVELEGEKDCPSPQAVARELERIVSAPDDAKPKDTALVLVEGSDIRIALVAEDGRLLGERRLPNEGACEERALSVAVVLGAWIASEHPEYASTLPEPQLAPAPSPSVTATPAPPLPEPAPMPVPVPIVPIPSAPPRDQEETRFPAVPREPPWETAIAAGAERSGSDWVFAGELSVRYAFERSGFGAAAFALLTTPAEREVGSGTVSSFRWPLGVGPFARWERGRVGFELRAGPMVGLLHLAGKGFATNDTSTDVQGGLYASLRVGARSGALRPFAAAAMLGWLGTVTASSALPNAEVDLPSVEAVLLAGAGFWP